MNTVLTIIVLLVLTLLVYLHKDVRYIDIPDYDVEEVPNFLSPEECDAIINLTHGKLFDSRTYSESEDLYTTDTRQSKQCWLKDEYHLIKNISDRVREYTNTHNNFQEELQVVSYTKGGFFKPHYDPCDGDKNFCKRMNGDNGPRLLTVLFYLNDDFEGGETIFPKINKVVKPQKGKAVIFRNVDNDGVIISQAVHGGEPVKNGEKWIANKWIRIQ